MWSDRWSPGGSPLEAASRELLVTNVSLVGRPGEGSAGVWSCRRSLQESDSETVDRGRRDAGADGEFHGDGVGVPLNEES